MGQKRKIEISAITIKIHPHPENIYSQFIQDIYNMRLPIKVHGEQYLLMSSIRKSFKDGLISGEIAKFTEIDEDLSWFNMNKFQEAEESELAKIVIPENLRPNYVSFTFMFDVEKHTFYFQTYERQRRLNPNTLKKYFQTISALSVIVNKYKNINFSVVQDKVRVRDLFKLETIRRVNIFVTRPNSETPGGLEEEVEKRLEEQYGESVEVIYKAQKGKSFKPDERTMNFVNTATKNGHVEVEGLNKDGILEHFSSANFPFQYASLYDPDKNSFLAAMRAAVKAAAELLKE